MSLSDYEYELPPELIAQEPPVRRGDSRLLVLDRASRSLDHGRFDQIAARIRPGDLVVINETRVFPARLRVRRSTGRQVEILLLEADGAAWSALAKPARALKPGLEWSIPGADSTAVRTLRREGEKVVVEFRQGGTLLSPEGVLDLCSRVGETPLPPYVRRDQGERPTDRERYQTVYARQTGAVAAPTAGLHFTREIVEQIRGAGATVAAITLHVGYGTFQPLSEEILAGSRLHPEWFEVPESSGRAILEARREKRRVIAVGTTSVRAIESFLADPRLPCRGKTEIFIKPGYRFLGVDAMITNFHLPRSSLLCLVCAFAGRDRILEAYAEAIRARYRFYSFGDAMLIL